jgi:cytoskeletal protein RodZ
MSEAPTQPSTPPPDGPPPPGGPPPPDGSSGGGRSPWMYAGIGAGVVALAVVLFLVFRPDDSDNTADTTATPSVQTTTSVETTTEATTESTTTVETTTEEVTTTAPADQPQRIVVNVENGQPVGGVKQVPVDEGSQVVLIVRADVEDEVHLHGYDLSADVAPGQPARITFTANVVGEFEAELEERAVPLVELVVS